MKKTMRKTVKEAKNLCEESQEFLGQKPAPYERRELEIKCKTVFTQGKCPVQFASDTIGLAMWPETVKPKVPMPMRTSSPEREQTSGCMDCINPDKGRLVLV